MKKYLPPVLERLFKGCGLCGLLPALFLTAAASAGTPSVVSAPAIDYTTLQLPQPGSYALQVLTPTLLEIVNVNSKQADPARVSNWDFIAASGTATLPAASEFAVTVNNAPVAVAAVGFKRRPLYAPLVQYDLRIDNRLYLQLASPVSSGQAVSVANPDATLWPSNLSLTGTFDPLQYSPAIHVNEEGYHPQFPKKAMVGYYLGSFGEMPVPSGAFTLVDTHTGGVVYSGTLTARQDNGWIYQATPYQGVVQADFSGFSTPGQYRLMVDGLGGSLAFSIDPGIAMDFTRAYALGLYHQRCGTANALPYTRFIHGACHTAPASIPVPQSSFANTWSMIASEATTNPDPLQTAPALTSATAQLYPYVLAGTIDVSGGHHDAGDYSKYTTDSAQMIHMLVFAADNFPGAAALDNLGIPESGDQKSDLLQEAKWEADFLAKMQDTDGGFFFLVYPRDRSYESNVLPDHGDPQVVWPKNTTATASAVAALAETASSPLFKSQFPNEAALYMQKAQLGWTFLMNAIAAHGKDGAYQKLTHYGDEFGQNDELAWAAAAMYAATGDTTYQTQLFQWYDPSSTATLRWTWWRLFEGYGCAARTYAFAASSGRLNASQLDAGYLAKCVAQIQAAGDDGLSRSSASAYGTAFDSESKRFQTAGWYFSLDRAFDIAVAYQLNPKPEYLDAIVTNMNYEGGCNPLNLSYITGIGYKRQREIVSQYAQNDQRILPPSGIPLGNIQSGFAYLNNYGTSLGALTFPPDGATTNMYPFYDRWGDSYNTTTEFTIVNQARGLATLAFLAGQTQGFAQSWNSAAATINVPSSYVPVNAPITLTLQSPLDTTGAEVVWEAQGQEPVRGSASYTYTPATTGLQWVEAELHWIDGRRAFATAGFATYIPNNDAPFQPDGNTIALYHFDTDYSDASGNGYTMTPAGNVSLAADNTGWCSNPVGKVARFHAIGDTLSVQIPDAVIMPGSTPSPVTFECHFYPRAYKAYSVANQNVISLFQNYDTSLVVQDGKWNSPAVPAVLAGALTPLTAAQWNSLVTLNTWHKLKLTLDATGQFTVYIDGVQAATTSAAGMNFKRTTPWTLSLGNFDGDVDEVRVSNIVR